MANDDTPIKINIDATEALSKLDDLKEDVVIKQDKLLLDMMVHAYDEEISRNELIDNKNSQMIVLSGVMLTLQATLFTELLVNHIIMNGTVLIKFKLLLTSLMFVSLIVNFIALYYFINAYAFQKGFNSYPESSYLVDKAKNNVSELKILEKLLSTFDLAIQKNNPLIDNKIRKARMGFKLLCCDGLLILIFLIIFVIVLF